MSKPDTHTLKPKSVRHKQILDLAAADPEASYQDIAEEIPSATADLVENVLDEYGDPADAATESDDEDPTSEMEDMDTVSVPDLDDLSDLERDTLRLIRDRPDATQQELADEMDVTAATISTRVNSIPGFDWTDREEFTDALFNDEDEPATDPPTEPADEETDESASDDSGETPTESTAEAMEQEPATDATTERASTSNADAKADGGDVEPTSSEQPAPMTETTQAEPEDPAPTTDYSNTEIEQQLRDLDARLDALESDPDDSVLADPELAHKVVHACMESDQISSEEELQIIRSLVE
jgi:hypothetical protein